MKNVFAALCLSLFASVALSGEVSVLKTEPTQETVAVATVSASPCDQCQTEVRALTLAPWQVRRLNRIADRQEVRDARKSCCGCCETSCRSTNVLVEARKKPCFGCCK